MISRKRSFLLLFLFLSTGLLMAQKPKELFRSDEVLEFSLTFDEKEVNGDLEERALHDAVLSLKDNSGMIKNLDIRVSVRGKTRARKSICRVPPLFLNFKKSETDETPFKKQKKLKLVTHCRNSKSYAEYVKKEYLAYRLYNIISPYSFKVRLCKIDYIDAKKPDQGEVHYGFLIEHIKDLSKRHDMKEYDGLLRNQESIEKNNLDRFVMFQYLIGNLDWSVPKRHNVKVMIGENATLPIAVPYDFDYCGLVNIPYAVPPDGFDIPDVRTRVFRGLCRDSGYGETIGYFMGIRDQLISEVTGASYLEESTRAEVLDYVNSFYRDIQNPTIVKEGINEACWAKHKHRYEY